MNRGLLAGKAFMILLAALAILAVGSAAQAQVVLYEGFNYTPISYSPTGSDTTTGSLGTNPTTGTNWTYYTGHFSNSYNTAGVISGGLYFNGMAGGNSAGPQYSPCALQSTVVNNPTYLGYQNIFQLPLSSNVLPVANSTMWVSYMWQPNSGDFYQPATPTTQSRVGFQFQNGPGDKGTYGPSYAALVQGPFSGPTTDGGANVNGPGIGYGAVQNGSTNSVVGYATGTAIPSTYNTTYMVVDQVTNVNPTAGHATTQTMWVLTQANYTTLQALDGGKWTAADLNANSLQTATVTDTYYVRQLTTSSYLQFSSVANFVTGMPSVTNTFGELRIGLTGADVSGTLIPGDINGDGLVDVADYDIWAANVGATGATWAQGDLNGDGLVDVADYDIWAANVGATSATPEPISMIILAIGGGLVALKRRNG